VSSEPTHYYVVFTDTEPDGRGLAYWRLFTRAAFRHCFVFWRDDVEWFRLDCNAYRLEIEVLPWARSADVPGIFRAAGGIVVKVEPRHGDEHMGRLPFGWITCVTVVKALLGINSRWTLTPYALYCLLREGGGGELCIEGPETP